MPANIETNADILVGTVNWSPFGGNSHLSKDQKKSPQKQNAMCHLHNFKTVDATKNCSRVLRSCVRMSVLQGLANETFRRE